MAPRVGVLGVDRLRQSTNGLDIRGAKLGVLAIELLRTFTYILFQVLVHVLEFEILFARDPIEALDLSLQVVVIESLAQRRPEFVIVPGLGD